MKFLEYNWGMKLDSITLLAQAMQTTSNSVYDEIVKGIIKLYVIKN